MARSSAYNSCLHISDIPTQVLSRPQRTWPALLTFFFLAPIISEILTGFTPPLMFITFTDIFSYSNTFMVDYYSLGKASRV